MRIPSRSTPTPQTLRTIFEELRDAGLGGIEVYYSEHPPAIRTQLAAVASDLGLVATGGSDYHGSGKPDCRSDPDTAISSSPTRRSKNLSPDAHKRSTPWSSRPIDGGDLERVQVNKDLSAGRAPIAYRTIRAQLHRARAVVAALVCLSAIAFVAAGNGGFAIPYAVGGVIIVVDALYRQKPWNLGHDPPPARHDRRRFHVRRWRRLPCFRSGGHGLCHRRRGPPSPGP